MKNKPIVWCAALLLCACAGAPVPPPAPAPSPCLPSVAVAAPDPDQVAGELLVFQSSVRQLKPAELARALAEPDPQAGSAGAALRRAMLIAAADARRQDEAQEKLAVQLREAQRRNEQLTEKLEALKNIERTLGVRAPAPAAPHQ
jgi:membrane-bound lytic murein transglycosylase B